MTVTVPSASLGRLPVWAYVVGAAAAVLLQIAVLHGLGQPLIAASGHILLWVGSRKDRPNGEPRA